MSDIVVDINICFHAKSGYDMSDDVKEALSIILEQVSEFKPLLNMNREDPNYWRIVTIIGSQMYSHTKKTGSIQRLTDYQMSVIDACVKYIARNQKELFGIRKTFPTRKLYRAVMMLTFTTFNTTYNVASVMNSISTMNRICKHGLHCYDKLITDILSQVNLRLGKVYR